MKKSDLAAINTELNALDWDPPLSHVLRPQPKPEPRKRTKARKDRAEAAVKKDVRAQCVERDGCCRLGKVHGLLGAAVMSVFGSCTSVSEWAHVISRAKTRGMAPTKRHATATSLMLCGGPSGGHHYAHDKGTGAKKLGIEALTDRGCDGPLRFTLNGTVYEEQDV